MPFVRIQQTGDPKTDLPQQGYNTDGTPQFDTKTDPHTHGIQLSEIMVVTQGSNQYFELALDMGEPGSKGSEASFLDLTDGQFFLASTGNIDKCTDPAGGVLGTNPTADNCSAPLGAPFYRLDSNANNKIILGDNNAGNGRIDYLWYIPVPTTYSPTDYLYFYSSYERAADGFEEWGVCHDKLTDLPVSCADVLTPLPSIPEPSSFILLGSGLLTLVRATRKKHD
jgi:hypothetical protein